jgi:hypothetical protein
MLFHTNKSAEETQQPQRRSSRPKPPLHPSPRNSKPFHKARSSLSTAVEELQPLSFFLPSSSLASVKDARAVKSAKPTTRRLRRSVRRLTVTRWNCARRDSEDGIREHTPSKVMMLWVDGEELTSYLQREALRHHHQYQNYQSVLRSVQFHQESTAPSQGKHHLKHGTAETKVAWPQMHRAPTQAVTAERTTSQEVRTSLYRRHLPSKAIPGLSTITVVINDFEEKIWSFVTSDGRG